ncbi:expressed unknown protein [Ectocarpus siliculosus]|uniref:Uncharacterized protein n=1 Tax=Ectocarpus siliculosus TaxID=2880 RepID=D8LN30_ECTSI|nr:expressed unknown protein [Ectocarpus siliculosus]|eukprot:CBN74793.1 expressed unknown protein [Ectocarpus siliculosus]
MEWWPGRARKITRLALHDPANPTTYTALPSELHRTGAGLLPCGSTGHASAVVLRVFDDGRPEGSSNERDQTGLFEERGSSANGILGARVGASAANVAVGRPVLESAEAAADSLVEIGVCHEQGNVPVLREGKIYHQFHNDMSEDYGRKHNNLRKQYAEEGTMHESTAPRISCSAKQH